MNTPQRNQVFTDLGSTLSIQVYNVNNTLDPSILQILWNAWNYFQVQWVEGTVQGSRFLNTFYGIRDALDRPFEGRGEQLTTMTFLEIDPGANTGVDSNNTNGVAQWSRVTWKSATAPTSSS